MFNVSCIILCRDLQKAESLKALLKNINVTCLGIVQTMDAALKAVEHKRPDVVFVEDALCCGALTKFAKCLPRKTFVILMGEQGNQALALEGFSTHKTVDYLVGNLDPARIKDTFAGLCCRSFA